MGTTIGTAYAKQFSDSVRMLSQQMGTRLRECCEEKSVTGNSTSSFERISPIEASVANLARPGRLSLGEVPHSRRIVSGTRLDRADSISEHDIMRILIDPKSEYAAAHAAALNRKLDSIIISAVLGNAAAQDDEGTVSNVALPSAQTIGHSSTNMTLEKILEARKKLMAAEVDLDFMQGYLVINASAHDSLLRETEFRSSDYNNHKVLVDGRLRNACGLMVKHSELLPANGASSSTQCFVMTNKAMKLGLWQDVTTTVKQEIEYKEAFILYSRLDIGAVRMEEEHVVEIECSQ